MLRLISRMIGRHKIQLLNFYPNLMRYLNSHNKDKISEIFAMIIESCHDLVPPENVKPVIAIGPVVNGWMIALYIGPPCG